MSSGCLYCVAVPIGNQKDISLRAIDILQTVNTVVCEEHRPAETLLKRLKIEGKELISLNEHTENDIAQTICTKIVAGESMALISDCGTPVFSDPGHHLIAALVKANVAVIPVPGASSMMAALSLCDFKVERFIYEGFLPRETDARKIRLTQLQQSKCPIVIMETPYRLLALLEDITALFGNNQEAILACDITLPTEKTLRGTIANIKAQLAKTETKKCEFVLIIKQGLTADSKKIPTKQPLRQSIPNKPHPNKNKHIKPPH